MLVEFTVGNYRSFREPQTLSLLAAPLKSKDSSLDENNVFDVPNNPSLLTSAVIYGANASGKSNLFQALDFMRSFVLESPKETKATGGIDVEPFRLSTVTSDQPSHFEIVFIASGKRYRYGFEVTQEQVEAEWLYFVPSIREARLFERDGQAFNLGSSFKEGRGIDQHTRPNALFLSVVAQFNGSTAQKLIAWFERLGSIPGSSDPRAQFFTKDQMQNSEKAHEIRHLIGRLDLGITDLEVEVGRESNWLPFPSSLPDEVPDELRRAFTTLNSYFSNSEHVFIHTVHPQYDEAGNVVDQVRFDLWSYESEGTKKLFEISGPLLKTLQEGNVLVVDELDARLHPLLTRELVCLFNNRETNPKSAQLIFNTQDTNLLDNTLFRRDQIWFIEKDRQGASHLYSLAEFRVRNDKSFERGYIQGRYGAIPYLGNLQTLVSESHAEEA